MILHDVNNLSFPFPIGSASFLPGQLLLRKGVRCSLLFQTGKLFLHHLGLEQGRTRFRTICLKSLSYKVKSLHKIYGVSKVYKEIYIMVKFLRRQKLTPLRIRYAFNSTESPTFEGIPKSKKLLRSRAKLLNPRGSV